MRDLPLTNEIGFVAASLVLATFCMRSMSALRWVAIVSNVAFIAYGYLGGLAPVLVLHVLLLPVNVYRLAQLRSAHVRDNWTGKAGERKRDPGRPPFSMILKVKPEASRLASLQDGRVAWTQ